MRTWALLPSVALGLIACGGSPLTPSASQPTEPIRTALTSGQYAGAFAVSEVKSGNAAACLSAMFVGSAQVSMTLTVGNPFSALVRSTQTPRWNCNYQGTASDEGFVALSTHCDWTTLDVLCGAEYRHLTLFSQQLVSYRIAGTSVTGWHVETWRDGDTLVTVTDTFTITRLP